MISLKFKQPPKKKEKGKGKGKGKGGSGRAQAVIDGVPISNMTKEQLEGHVIRFGFLFNYFLFLFGNINIKHYLLFRKRSLSFNFIYF